MIFFPEESLEEIEKGYSLEQKQKKLEEFKSLKKRLAFFNRRDEKTQEEFDRYVQLLFDSEQCKYTMGIKDIVDLCNNNLFECEFRNRDNFKFHGKLKFECTREKTLQLKKLL